MSRPTIVLGIDALDWEIVAEYRESLPSLAAFPVLGPLRSIVPPDSIPAWTTIFTGKSPGEHGRLESIDYLDDQPSKAVEGSGDALRGNTFWDEASRRGARVCVVNPFMAYPAWDVNGVMISGPVFVSGEASITGIAREELAPLPQLGGIVDFPTRRTVGPFVESVLRDTREQADFAIDTFDKVGPELFFLNILTVDRIKHFLWRFFDESDPTWPGPNPHSDAILRMYRLIDEIVGEFATRGHVVVLSDHGHARRCTRMVFIDEALRRAGLAAPPHGFKATTKAILLERAKRTALRASYEFAKEDELYALARKLPNRKSLKYSGFSQGKKKPPAKLSRAFGRNAHSGIELAVDTPEIRQRVREVLNAIRDPKTGAGVIEWVADREDIVSGASLERYPHILFKLSGDYGVDFGMFGGLFAPDVNHRRISGGHRPLGVFGSSEPMAAPKRLEDVYDALLTIAAPA